MDGKPNIHQRMLAVMKDVGYIQKGDKTVNNQYRFVSHDSVTAKLRVAFIEHGIVATTHVERHSQDGNRTEVDVRVEFINVDEPSDRVTINAFGYGIDPQDKGPGKAVSYAVKYAYLKAFALETGDDPERDSIDHKPAEKRDTRPNTPTQVNRDAYMALGDDERAFIDSEAAAVKAHHAAGMDERGLWDYVKSRHLTDEETMALWSVLPANIRSAIKRGKPEAALASQA